MKSLVVEDDLLSQQVVQEIIQEYGPVQIAENGKEAIKAVEIAFKENQPFDLVCLDLIMPEMGGVETLKTIRAIEEKKKIFPSDGMKIIVITVIDNIKSVSKAYYEMCDGYVCKPITKHSLLDEIKKHNLIEIDD